MGVSYGNILAQGLIGGVMGASRASYELAIEEQKAERRAVEEERLSKLRMGEYKAKAEFEQKMKDDATTKERERIGKTAMEIEAGVTDAPSKSVIDETTDGENVEGIINGRKLSAREKSAAKIAAAQARGEKDLVSQYEKQHGDLLRVEDREADRSDRKTDREERNKDRDEDRAERKAARGEARQDREEARRDAKERDERHQRLAAERDWKVDADGNYRRPDGSIVTEEIREGGKLLGTRPVKAPVKSGKDWKTQEELDSLNRRIETAEKNGDDELKVKLEREKSKLLGSGARAPSASSSSSSRPPLSSFNR